MTEHKPAGPNRKQGQRLTGVKMGIAAVAIGFTVGVWGILANTGASTSQAANTTATPGAVVAQVSTLPTAALVLPTATATSAPPTPTTQAAATTQPVATATTAPAATTQPAATAATAPTATAQPTAAAAPATSSKTTTTTPTSVTRTRSSK